MTIRSRLLVAFAAVTLLLGTPLAYAVNRLRAVRSIAVTLRDRHAGAYAALGGLRAAIAEYDRQARSYVIVPDPEFRAGMLSALATARSEEQHLESAGFADVATPAGRWLDSLAAATRELEGLVQAGRQDEATALTGTRVLPTLASIQTALGPVQVAVSTSSAEQAARARDISATATVIGTGAAVLALLIAAAIAWWTMSAVTDPLRRLRRSMAAVAEGTTTADPRLPYLRNDEIGDLSRSFRTMTEQLAELERVRGEFLNLVSHDLKAPISLISSYADLIEEDAPSALEPQSYRLLESIREHTRHLTERVNRLLSLGRLEARAYPVHPEPVSVRAFFQGVRAMFEPQARREGIDFSLTIEPDTPESMRADAECLQHEILDNLLSNAFKFTPEGGRVSVRVWGDAGGVHCSVTDSGPGIPEDDLPYVFDKYFQARHGSAGAGAGLGLTIAHEVVLAHGGTIAVSNVRGGGTMFHITLPEPNGGAGPSHPAAPPEHDVARPWRIGGSPATTGTPSRPPVTPRGAPPRDPPGWRGAPG